jgi:hypothetical protein
MLYNTHNYWVFGLFPSSSILETRKQFPEYRMMEDVQKPSNSEKYADIAPTRDPGSLFSVLVTLQWGAPLTRGFSVLNR